MLKSIATDGAPLPAPPTAIAATALSTGLAARVLHGLLGLQLPLRGDFLCDRRVGDYRL